MNLRCNSDKVKQFASLPSDWRKTIRKNTSLDSEANDTDGCIAAQDFLLHSRASRCISYNVAVTV